MISNYASKLPEGTYLRGINGLKSAIPVYILILIILNRILYNVVYKRKN